MKPFLKNLFFAHRFAVIQGSLLLALGATALFAYQKLPSVYEDSGRSLASPPQVKEAEEDSDYTKQQKEENRQFLMRMGYEDNHETMVKSLEEENFINPSVSREVLKYQTEAERFQMYNHARELAVEILATLDHHNKSPEARARVVKFVAQLLVYKPTPPPSKYPADILSEKDPVLKEQKITRYAKRIAKQHIEYDIQIMSSNLIGVLYSKAETEEVLRQIESGSLDTRNDPRIKKVAELMSRLEKLVIFNNIDMEMGSFALGSLGKAIILGIARRAKLQERAGNQAGNNLLAQLDAEFKNYESDNLHLQNYIGTKLRVNVIGGYKEVQVKNGDHLHELSQGNQSFQIPAFAKPSGWNTLRAWNYGNFPNMAFWGVIFGKDIEDTDAYKNAVKRALDYVVNTRAFRGGVSHIGAAQVLLDPETGLETTRSIDSYIDNGDRAGGIRITDILHQFAKPSEFLKLVVSRYDAKKLFRWFKEYARTVGYQAVISKGDLADREGNITRMDARNWHALIPKETFEEMANWPDSRAEEFLEFLNQGTIDVLLKEFLHKGLGFAYGFSNEYGRAYCTKAIFLATMMATGLDVQKHPDHWAHKLNILSKVIPELKEQAEQGLLEHRILAPAGMTIWNAGVGGEVQYAVFPRVDHHEREKLGYGPELEPMFPELHDRLKEIQLFQKLTKINFVDAELTPLDLAISTEIEKELAREGDKFGIEVGGRSRRGLIPKIVRDLRESGEKVDEAVSAGVTSALNEVASWFAWLPSNLRDFFGSFTNSGSNVRKAEHKPSKRARTCRELFR